MDETLGLDIAIWASDWSASIFKSILSYRNYYVSDNWLRFIPSVALTPLPTYSSLCVLIFTSVTGGNIWSSVVDAFNFSASPVVN